jgi:hypothetical protein
VLLEEGDEEVDREHGVGKDLLLVHLDVTDSDTEAEDLLELELDGRADLGDLVAKVLVVGDGGRELTGLGETGTEKTRDLLDEGLGREESVVLLGELWVEEETEISTASEWKVGRTRRTFLTSFLFLLSFFKSSTDMYSSSMSLARSMSAASARMQMDMRGRGR